MTSSGGGGGGHKFVVVSACPLPVQPFFGTNRPRGRKHEVQTGQTGKRRGGRYMKRFFILIHVNVPTIMENVGIVRLL